MTPISISHFFTHPGPLTNVANFAQYFPDLVPKVKTLYVRLGGGGTRQFFLERGAWWWWLSFRPLYNNFSCTSFDVVPIVMTVSFIFPYLSLDFLFLFRKFSTFSTLCSTFLISHPQLFGYIQWLYSGKIFCLFHIFNLTPPGYGRQH